MSSVSVLSSLFSERMSDYSVRIPVSSSSPISLSFVHADSTTAQFGDDSQVSALASMAALTGFENL